MPDSELCFAHLCRASDFRMQIAAVDTVAGSFFSSYYYRHRYFKVADLLMFRLPIVVAGVVVAAYSAEVAALFMLAIHAVILSTLAFCEPYADGGQHRTAMSLEVTSVLNAIYAVMLVSDSERLATEVVGWGVLGMNLVLFVYSLAQQVKSYHSLALWLLALSCDHRPSRGSELEKRQAVVLAAATERVALGRDREVVLLSPKYAWWGGRGDDDSHDTDDDDDEPVVGNGEVADAPLADVDVAGEAAAIAEAADAVETEDQQPSPPSGTMHTSLAGEGSSSGVAPLLPLRDGRAATPSMAEAEEPSAAASPLADAVSDDGDSWSRPLLDGTESPDADAHAVNDVAHSTAVASDESVRDDVADDDASGVDAAGNDDQSELGRLEAEVEAEATPRSEGVAATAAGSAAARDAAREIAAENFIDAAGAVAAAHSDDGSFDMVSHVDIDDQHADFVRFTAAQIVELHCVNANLRRELNRLTSAYLVRCFCAITLLVAVALACSLHGMAATGNRFVDGSTVAARGYDQVLGGYESFAEMDAGCCCLQSTTASKSFSVTERWVCPAKGVTVLRGRVSASGDSDGLALRPLCGGPRSFRYNCSASVAASGEGRDGQVVLSCGDVPSTVSSKALDILF